MSISTNSIPNYPKFSTIDLKHRPHIDRITEQFPPYCDFRFSNIYNWSADSYPTRISYLFGNLVFKMKDFASDKLIISYIGKNERKKTVQRLLCDYPYLTMVPKESISKHLYRNNSVKIFEDVDNHEYILDLEKVSTLKGSKYKSKRKHVARFKKKYSNIKTKSIDISKPAEQEKIFQLMSTWRKNKKISYSDTKREVDALRKYLSLHPRHYDILAYGLFDRNRLIAFTLNEVAHDNYAMGRFGKADVSYKGVYDYLESQTASRLLESGCKYLNYEQDLGIYKLRKAKMSWYPVFFLKKFIIESRIS